MWLGTILPLRASTAQRGRQRANSPSLLALGYPSSASDPDTPSSQVLRDSLGREVGGGTFSRAYAAALFLHVLSESKSYVVPGYV